MNRRMIISPGIYGLAAAGLLTPSAHQGEVIVAKPPTKVEPPADAERVAVITPTPAPPKRHLGTRETARRLRQMQRTSVTAGEP